MSVAGNILAVNTDSLQSGFQFAHVLGGASGLSTSELALAAGKVGFHEVRRKWFALTGLLVGSVFPS